MMLPSDLDCSDIAGEDTETKRIIIVCESEEQRIQVLKKLKLSDDKVIHTAEEILSKC
jgi:hypothetical protein